MLFIYDVVLVRVALFSTDGLYTRNSASRAMGTNFGLLKGRT